MGLRMLLLLHALIPCLAAYILPSSPVLLHNILLSSPVLLHIAIYCTCFSTFWHCHPYILQHFNGNVFTLFIKCVGTAGDDLLDLLDQAVA